MSKGGQKNTKRIAIALETFNEENKNVDISPREKQMVENCGFQAIPIAVYGTKTRWTEVKDRMLETYRRCESSLYRGRFR
ncbi:hypothetical protein CU097_002743, partial [Rhizopus azygosporus]